MNEIQKKVNKVFEKTFGRTPLKQRLEDILGEAIAKTIGHHSAVENFHHCMWSRGLLLCRNFRQIACIESLTN